MLITYFIVIYFDLSLPNVSLKLLLHRKYLFNYYLYLVTYKVSYLFQIIDKYDLLEIINLLFHISSLLKHNKS